MKLLIRILIFLSISVFLIECMSSEKVTTRLQIAIVNSKVNAWLNLMPGTSPGTFHLVGEITIENQSDGDIEDIKLDSVSIYSGTGEIYSITPYFKTKLQGQDFSILKNAQKEFSFGTEKGLEITEFLKQNNHVDIKLIFSSGEKNFSYLFKNIEIERAY